MDDLSKEQLLKEVELLQQKITDLEEKLQHWCADDEDNFPHDIEEGDIFYTLDKYGKIDQHQWTGDDYDCALFSMGNMYKTEKEAYNKGRKLFIEANAKRDQNNYGNKVIGKPIEKWYFEYNMRHNTFHIHKTYKVEHMSSLGSWETKEGVERFIDENREDLLWYFTHK